MRSNYTYIRSMWLHAPDVVNTIMNYFITVSFDLRLMVTTSEVMHVTARSKFWYKSAVEAVSPQFIICY